jgi:hypothetical protein
METFSLSLVLLTWSETAKPLVSDESPLQTADEAATTAT